MNLKRPHIRNRHAKLLNLLTAKTPYSEVLELELWLHNQPDCVATGGREDFPGHSWAAYYPSGVLSMAPVLAEVTKREYLRR